MSTGEVNFEVERQDAPTGSTATVVALSGEFDLSVAQAFSEALNAALEGPAVVLVMDEVVFMDSSALHIVLGAKEGLDGDGVPVVLAAADGSVAASLFDVTGLTGFLPRYGTVEEALHVLE
ncbi:MAG: anti-sigma factor antagonist [Thermoleophilaceae bacterium]|jgi:anti-anti-sigma factor|nr:anti-sigma factor antagonist [Thermoleophilaceae bacterium]